MIIPFEHKSQAHCESGVISNLLQHKQLPISEPMAFGIGSGIFFAHIPFIKVSGMPGTTYRVYPGKILSNVCNRLGVEFKSEKFSNADAAMQKLNENIDNQIPTGMQVGVFYLPFLPDVFRFHFNAHNLIAIGRENNTYHISDPVMEKIVTIEYQYLAKARFAKGYPEPKGRMYYLTKAPKMQDINLGLAIEKGIKQTCFFMKSPPLKWFGVTSIDFLSKEIRKYPSKLDARKSTLYLGNIIRMQEEIGTGGAGFRYLYAAFLQEAAAVTNNLNLKSLSEEMTLIGDEWRNFAYQTARICKARNNDIDGFNNIADILHSIYLKEDKLYTDLKKIY